MDDRRIQSELEGLWFYDLTFLRFTYYLDIVSFPFFHSRESSADESLAQRPVGTRK